MPRTYTRRPRVQLHDRQALQDAIMVRAVTARAFAVAAGLSVPTVAHLLAGRRDRCLEKFAVELCAALDVPVGSLFLPDRPSGGCHSDIYRLSQETFT